MNLPDMNNPPFEITSSFHSPRHTSSAKRKKAKSKKAGPAISAPMHQARPSRPITREEIMDARSPAAKRAGIGSWTKIQMAEWGVPHPPGKGWIERLIMTSHEPQVCGPHCQTETVFNAALSVIMQCSGISRDEALDAFVHEFLAGR